MYSLAAMLTPSKRRTQMTFQTQDNKPNAKTFIAEIWEKAEHWTFETSIRADSREEAFKQLLKDFPRKSYTVRNIW